MIKTERTLIIGRSGCGKTFLMLSLSKDKNPDDDYTICQTDNQYPSKYHNQSKEILPLEDFGNKIIDFDNTLGSKEAKDIDVFLLVVAIKILIFITSLNHGMNCLKTLFEIFCCRIMLFSQALKDITTTYNDISGLHMNFLEWREFCRDAWKKRFNYIQIDKDKGLDDSYSIKNVSSLEITAVPETTAF